MSIGYTEPLYILACDQRTSFARLLGTPWPMPTAAHAEARRLKGLVLDALVRAAEAEPSLAGATLLVDEDLGGPLAARAHERGLLLAMPIEASGSAEFRFEYGSAWTKHLERLRPDLAKVLVRRHPRADRELLARENERLRAASEWLHARDWPFIFELVVPPLPADLEGSTRERFDADVRPALVMEVMTGLQSAGVEPDVWMIEGLERVEDCREVAAVARRDGRPDVRCIVLGRGADPARVDRWLETAHGVEGYSGFAIGRSLWWDELARRLVGSASEAQVIEAIAAGYVEAHRLFAEGGARV